MSLNPWLALILGILIGWLLEWLLELWFFRRRRLQCEDRLAEAEAQLRALDTDLGDARARADSLEADLDAHKAHSDAPGAAVGAVRLDAGLPAVEVAAPIVAAELPDAMTKPPEAASPLIEAELPKVEAKLPKVELTSVEAEPPKVEVDLPRVELPSVEAALPELEAELPKLEAELPVVELPSADSVLPKVEVELPSVEAALPELEAELPKPEAELPVVELPSGEAVLPKVEVDLPRVQLPSVEAALPTLAAQLPSVEAALPEIEAELPKAELSAIEAELPKTKSEAPVAEADIRWPEIAAGIEAAAEMPTAGIGGVKVAAKAPDVALPETAIEVTAPSVGAEADALLQVKGIGPKYASELAAAGITSVTALASTSPERLKAIVNAPDWRQVDYSAWVAEAKRLGAAPRPAAGDDLTTLEGIGPVYDAKLKQAGITTFAQLAAADEAELARLIAAPAWRRVNYGEWIAQAKLAAAGDAAGLKALQDTLFDRGGENIALVSGIGEKAASALVAAGITSYAGLAAATPEKLGEIIKAAGARGGDFGAWIEEAKLRAAGKRIKRATRAASVPINSQPCPQDLSRIRGIGSAHEVKLYGAGIGTYWELAKSADDELLRVLEAKDFQAVDVAAIKAEALKLAEETNSVGRTWDGTAPDDFETLAGIGEVYERRLYDAGICTWRKLAELTEGELQEICQAPGWRKPDYAAWLVQARRLASPGG